MAETETDGTTSAAPAEQPKTRRRQTGRKSSTAAKSASTPKTEEAAPATPAPKTRRKTAAAAGDTDKPARKTTAAKRAPAKRKAAAKPRTPTARAVTAVKNATPAVTAKQVALGAGVLGAVAAGVATFFNRKKIASAVAEHTPANTDTKTESSSS
jgi:hypothetical protein